MREAPNDSSRVIIGITGPTCAGKGTMLSILKTQGFLPLSMGDFVREEVRRRGLLPEQPHLHNIVYEMLNADASVLATSAIKNIRATLGQFFAIDGIRTLPTLVRLKEEKNVVILGITAPREQLIERIIRRARPGDPTTSQEANHFLDREWGEGEPVHGYKVGQCLQMADTTIENNGTMAELEKKVLGFCDRIKAKNL